MRIKKKKLILWIDTGNKSSLFLFSLILIIIIILFLLFFFSVSLQKFIKQIFLEQSYQTLKRRHTYTVDRP